MPPRRHPVVAGLPLNITTPDGLSELPITDSPNPAFDPFASSVVELPAPPPPSNVAPFDPGPSAATPPPQTTPPPNTAPPSSDPNESTLSQEDFERWRNGTADLPNLPPDPGANGPTSSPNTPPASVPANPVPPGGPPSSGPSSTGNDSGVGNEPPSSAPPGESVERTLAYEYPKAACEERLEGDAEYRIWVSSQGTPVVSDIVKSTNSVILDRAVKAEVKKYNIKPEDANKLVVLPFDFKYSEKVCAKADTSNAPKSGEDQPSPDQPPEPNEEGATKDKNDPTKKGPNPTPESKQTKPPEPSLPDLVTPGSPVENPTPVTAPVVPATPGNSENSTPPSAAPQVSPEPTIPPSSKEAPEPTIPPRNKEQPPEPTIPPSSKEAPEPTTPSSSEPVEPKSLPEAEEPPEPTIPPN